MTSSVDDRTTPRAGRREWIGLAVIALPCVVYAMDLTVLNLAVPSLSADLAPSSAQLLWIVDIYGFLVAGSLITMGTLGDRIGRRRLLVIGAVCFGVASVMAAFARSAEVLIATRAILGLAGATLAPSTLSLIRNMFLDPRQRTTAVGIWISSYSAGGAIGPLVGGLLLEHFWWGSVFLIAVPVMALLVIAAPVLLPEYRDPQAGRLDLASAALSMAAVLPTIYGLKHLAQNGFGWPVVAATAAGGAAAALFIRRQRRLADPLLDLRLFEARAFSMALITYTLATFVTFGVFVFIAQYLQLVLGLSPLKAGLWTAPFALSFIAGSTACPLIIRRFRPIAVITVGLLVAAVGFGVLTQVDHVSSLGLLVTGFVIFCLGLSPAFTLTNDMIIAAAPPERAGAASAMSETGSELGGALGIAVLGSIGTAIYRGAMSEAVLSNLSGDAIRAARDTIGGAVAVAGQLPSERGMYLLVTAREAFTRTLQMTAGISAIIVVLTAIMTAIWLKQDESREA